MVCLLLSSCQTDPNQEEGRSFSMVKATPHWSTLSWVMVASLFLDVFGLKLDDLLEGMPC